MNLHTGMINLNWPAEQGRPKGRLTRTDDVSHQNLMTCENVTKFELFFTRDRSRIWNHLSHLDPLFEPFWLSISIFGVPKWSGHGQTRTRTYGRTHMIFWDLPYTISPSGKKQNWNFGIWIRDIDAGNLRNVRRRLWRFNVALQF